jgi:hypothetical protein
LTADRSEPSTRRVTTAAPGSSRITASTAELPSDLIGVRAFAREPSHLGFLTTGFLPPLGQELVDRGHLVAEELARQPLHAPDHGFGGQQGHATLLFVDAQDQAAAALDAEPSAHVRRQAEPATLGDLDPNVPHGESLMPVMTFIIAV